MKSGQNKKNRLLIIKYLLSEDKVLLVLPFVLVLSRVANELAGIWLPKVVLDGVTENIAFSKLLFVIIAIVLIILVTYVLSEWLDYSIHKRNTTVNFALQKRLDRRSLDIDYSTFSAPAGKELKEKAVMALDGWSGNTFKDYIPALIEFGSSVLLTFSYVWILFDVSFYMVILLFGCYFISMWIVVATNKKINENDIRRAKISQKLEYLAEATRNSSLAKDIRLFSMSGWIEKVGKQIKLDQKKVEKRVISLKNRQVFFNAIIVFIRDGVAYAYLVHQFLAKELSIGDFALFFAAIAGFGNSLNSIISGVGNLLNCNHELQNLTDFLELEDNVHDNKNLSVLKEKGKFKIELQSVSYSYPNGDKKVLDNVSFIINPGEKIALVGVNGAGKTTLVKIICGLLTPDSGKVLINDLDIRGFANEELFSIFAMVFQDIFILPNSVRDNITFQNEDEIDMDRYKKSLSLSGIDSKISRLEKGDDTLLIPQINEGAVQFSGGEMQKLQLARAIYRQGDILILDEPTAALDPIAEYEMYQKYNQFSKNSTSVFISHRLASTKFCDRILLLADARIVEQGTHEELLGLKGEYYHMFEVQSKYYKDGDEKNEENN